MSHKDRLNKLKFKTPYMNRWFVRQQMKKHRYFCDNCLHSFRTGKFSRFDSQLYDDVCPNCGAIGLTFEEAIDELRDYIVAENKKGEK